MTAFYPTSAETFRPLSYAESLKQQLSRRGSRSQGLINSSLPFRARFEADSLDLLALSVSHAFLQDSAQVLPDSSIACRLFDGQSQLEYWLRVHDNSLKICATDYDKSDRIVLEALYCSRSSTLRPTTSRYLKQDINAFVQFQWRIANWVHLNRDNVSMFPVPNALRARAIGLKNNRNSKSPTTKQTQPISNPWIA